MASQCHLLLISYWPSNKYIYFTQCEVLFQSPQYAHVYSMVVIIKPSAKHLENSVQVNSSINYPTIIMLFSHFVEPNIMIWSVYL